MLYAQSGSPPLPMLRKFIAVFLRRYLLPVATALSANLTLAAEPASVSLLFEIQALDLDGGLVVDRNLAVPESDGADVYAAYHADRTPHATLIPMPGSEMALISGAHLSEVTAEDITAATFSPEPEDLPLENDSSALVRSADGSVFLIGNATETDTSVSFQYMRVE